MIYLDYNVNPAGFINFTHRTRSNADKGAWARLSKNGKQITVQLPEQKLSDGYAAEFEEFLQLHGASLDNYESGERIALAAVARAETVTGGKTIAGRASDGKTVVIAQTRQLSLFDGDIEEETEKPARKAAERGDIYQEITDLILDKLGKGLVPWRETICPANMPRNAVSGKEYRGVNTFLLQDASKSFSSNYWLTYRQAKELGGYVKKGETGYPVVFWKTLNVEREIDGETKTKRVPIARRSVVFNIDQCENVKLPKRNVPNHADPIEAAEKIIAGMPNRPEIKITNTQNCYYDQKTDTVVMQSRQIFSSNEQWYCNLFHELAHSTSHENRLDRDRDFLYGSEGYAKEELIAEMAACFLCAACGIEQPILDGATTYIEAWMKAIDGNRRLVINAAAVAQRVADYIRNITY